MTATVTHIVPSIRMRREDLPRDLRGQFERQMEHVTFYLGIHSESSTNEILAIVESEAYPDIGWLVSDQIGHIDNLPANLHDKRGWWIARDAVEEVLNAVTNESSPINGVAARALNPEVPVTEPPVVVEEDPGSLLDVVSRDIYEATRRERDEALAQLAQVRQESVLVVSARDRAVQQKESAEGLVAELRTVNASQDQAHRDDVAKIGEMLLTEARNRDWCSDYDSIIAELNPRLTVELPVREREYEVTVEVRYTVSRTVQARSGDDAFSLVNDDWRELDRLTRSAEIEEVRCIETEVQD